MSEKVYIDVDFTEGFEVISDGNRKLEELKENTRQTVEVVDQATKTSYLQVLSMARSVYQIGLGLYKSTGATVSYFFRAMVSAAFGTIQVLAPLLQAQAAQIQNPVAVMAAYIGLAELGVSLISVLAAQAEQQQIARGMRGVAMTLDGLSNLLGHADRFE